jgi:hypothetical protein
MFWFRQSFEKKFKRIKGGWTSSKVRQVLGEPAEAEDTKVPDGSVWGTQPAMAHKIQAGDPSRSTRRLSINSFSGRCCNFTGKNKE